MCAIDSFVRGETILLFISMRGKLTNPSPSRCDSVSQSVHRIASLYFFSIKWSARWMHYKNIKYKLSNN